MPTFYAIIFSLQGDTCMHSEGKENNSSAWYFELPTKEVGGGLSGKRNIPHMCAGWYYPMWWIHMVLIPKGSHAWEIFHDHSNNWDRQLSGSHNDHFNFYGSRWWYDKHLLIVTSVGEVLAWGKDFRNHTCTKIFIRGFWKYCIGVYAIFLHREIHSGWYHLGILRGISQARKRWSTR